MPRFWILAVAVLGLAEHAGADEPVKRYKLVTPKEVDIAATGINERGDVIGFEWAEEKERPGVLEQKPFYARGKEMTYLPLLKTYTATFPAAISDDGMVVGRASKPAPPNVFVHLRNQAFAWDAKTGIHGLGTLKDDSASHACGVSRDGRRISGYSVGRNNRMRVCVWEREGDGWKGLALPQQDRLGSNVVAISRDGRHVTAVDGVVPCLWTRDDSGTWTREVIGGTGVLVPRAVNDAGTVVGLRFLNDGYTHAVIWTRAGGIQTLERPKGYVTSEANAVNNAGVVVGMIDGPHGSKTGPNAFIYEAGRLRLLEEGGPVFASATAINDKGEVAGVFESDED